MSEITSPYRNMKYKLSMKSLEDDVHQVQAWSEPSGIMPGPFSAPSSPPDTPIPIAPILYSTFR